MIVYRYANGTPYHPSHIGKRVVIVDSNHPEINGAQGVITGFKAAISLDYGAILSWLPDDPTIRFDLGAYIHRFNLVPERKRNLPDWW